MNKTKKIIAIAVALMIVLSVVVATNVFADNTYTQNIQAKIDAGTYDIAINESGTINGLTIPANTTVTITVNQGIDAQSNPADTAVMINKITLAGKTIDTDTCAKLIIKDGTGNNNTVSFAKNAVVFNGNENELFVEQDLTNTTSVINTLTDNYRAFNGVIPTTSIDAYEYKNVSEWGVKEYTGDDAVKSAVVYSDPKGIENVVPNTKIFTKGNVNYDYGIVNEEKTAGSDLATIDGTNTTLAKVGKVNVTVVVKDSLYYLATDPSLSAADKLAARNATKVYYFPLEIKPYSTATFKLNDVSSYVDANEVTHPLLNAKSNVDAGLTYSDGAAVKFNKSAIDNVVIGDYRTKLTWGTDFSVDYNNNINAGTAELIIYGEGNYKGSSTVFTFPIHQKVIDNANKVTFKEGTLTTSEVYTGSAIKPSATIVVEYAAGKTKEYDLTSETTTGDFKLVYGANTNCTTGGTVTVSTEGMNGNYKLQGTGISDQTIVATKAFAITKKNITPEVRLYKTADGEKTDVSSVPYNTKNENKALYNYSLDIYDKDLENYLTKAITDEANITYKNSEGNIVAKDEIKNQGTYTIVIEQKENSANYTFKKIEKTFTVTASENARVATLAIANIDDQVYIGNDVEPVITVTNTNVEGAPQPVTADDYTVEYTNNTAIGTATVTVTPRNTLKGNSVSKTFRIVAPYSVKVDGISALVKDDKGTLVNASDDSYVYTGSTINPDGIKVSARVKATLESGETPVLLDSRDYTATYSDNVNAGTAKITLKLAGSFAGLDKEHVLTGAGYTRNADTLEITGGEFTIAKKSIADMKVNDIADITATGKEIAIPTVTISGLTSGKDYSVVVSPSGTKIINVGTYTLRIKGEGNYTGTITKTFKVVGPTATITTAAIEGKTYYDPRANVAYMHKIANTTIKYNDIVVTPDVKYTFDDGLVLDVNGNIIDDTNYDAKKNVAGQRTVTVSIVDGEEFTGSKTYTYRVEKLPVVITSTVHNREYGAIDNNTISLKSTIEGKTGLTSNELITALGKDLSIEHTPDNENVGTITKTVSVKSDNFVAESVTKTFKITQNVTPVDFEVLPVVDEVYRGIQITPEVEVRLNNKVLVQDVDYKLTYGANKEVGKGTITVEGINYADINGGAAGTTKTVEFDIVKSDIKDAYVNIADQEYTGKAIEPKMTITNAIPGISLVEGTDYEIVGYMNNVEVGKATIVISGKGNYTGTKTVTFNIVKKSKIDISNATVIVNTTKYTYNGKAKKPSVTVRLDGGLLPSSAYTVSYKANKNVGKATVTVTGKGDYTGTAKAGSFTIVPNGTTVKSFSAKKKTSVKVTVKAQKTQTSGYNIQRATDKNFKKNAKTVSVKNSTTTKKLTGLKKNTKYFVRVRTYKKVNGKTYYSSWSDAKTVKTAK